METKIKYNDGIYRCAYCHENKKKSKQKTLLFILLLLVVIIPNVNGNETPTQNISETNLTNTSQPIQDPTNCYWTGKYTSIICAPSNWLQTTIQTTNSSTFSMLFGVITVIIIITIIKRKFFDY